MFAQHSLDDAHDPGIRHIGRERLLPGHEAGDVADALVGERFGIRVPVYGIHDALSHRRNPVLGYDVPDHTPAIDAHLVQFALHPI